ncbi:MAG: M56 family metallopeptidase [Gemmatimonadaceae bacterium]
MTIAWTMGIGSAPLAWVLDVSAKSAMVLAAALLATRWRRTSAATRHAVLCASVVAALGVPVVRTVLPAWKVALLPAADDVATEVVTASVPTDGSIASTVEAASAGTNPVSAVPSSESPANAEEPGQAIVERAEPFVVHAESPLPLPSAVFLVWMIGAACVLAPWLLGWMRLRRLWDKALPPEGEWRDAWQRMAPRRRPLELRVSQLTDVPMTWGLRRPVVLVPVASVWTPAQRRAALQHELAHVDRWDALWQSLSRLLLATSWFNPLVWMTDAALRAESERACDDAVLRSGARASEYAQQLVDVLRTVPRKRVPGAVAMTMARRSGIARRLRALLDAGERRTELSSTFRTVIVALTGVIAVPIARVQPVPATRGIGPSIGATTGAPRGGFMLDSSNSPSGAASLNGAAPSAPMATSALAEVPESTKEAPSRAPLELRGLNGDGLALAVVPGSDRLGTDDLRSTSIARLLSALVSPERQSVDCLGSRASSQGSSVSIESNDHRRSMRVKWSDEACRVTFDVEGDLRLNEDATDVVGLSRGGSLELNVKDGKASRRVTMDESNGSIQRSYWVDGEKKPWDADAAAWFARALVALDRRSAFAADQRVPALLRQGGVDAVLAEAEQMSSGYAARIYYAKLFKLQPLTTAQIQRVLARAAQRIDSDYERAELLLAVAKLDNFGANAYVAFADAAAGIKSDYEKRRALTALLSKPNVSAAAAKQMLAAAQDMKSDYELAELLIGIASRYAISDDTRPLYLSALGSLNSDYEHRRVLDTIVKAGGLNAAVTRALLADAARMHSDYELAEFLTGIAASGTLDSSNADQFFQTLQSVHGDYEFHRVLSAVLKRDDADKDLLRKVLEAAGHLSSDYERASLLVEVAATGPFDDATRAAYDRAAEGIKSEYEYGRAMMAVRRTKTRL